MKAVILAAGRGTRLDQGSVVPLPKILLEVGGVSLLEWHYRRLLSVGLEEVTVIVGYESGLVCGMIERLNSRYACQGDTVFNANFASGSVVSMNVAVEKIQETAEGILLIDGDVLYPSAMLRRLIDSPHESCLLIDRLVDVEDPEPVLVPLRRGKPIDFVKGWSGSADFIGESIGFFKVRPRDREWLVSAAAILAQNCPGEPYEEVIRSLVKLGRLGCEDVTGMPWIEIDFASDLKMAREQIVFAVQTYESIGLPEEESKAKQDVFDVEVGHSIH